MQDLSLRSYQRELAEYPLAGFNTMIVAPTGCGKTRVAVAVMQDHIQNRRNQGKPVSVLFLVPTVPLVKQQSAVIEGHFADLASVKAISGDNNVVFALDLAPIIVCTPQIVVNAIVDGKNALAMSSFSLVVLDEAHHAISDHPYAILMKMYHAQKYGSGQVALRTMPQIVGMTASLGSTKSPTSVEEVIDHIYGMCAGIDAERIGLVHRHQAELERFVAATLDEIFVMRDTDDPGIQDCKQRLALFMEQIQDAFMSLPDIKGKYAAIFSQDMPSTPEHESQYIGWLRKLREELLPTSSALPSATLRMARRHLDTLDRLFNAYLCSQCFPGDVCFAKYLKPIGEAYQPMDAVYGIVQAQLKAFPKNMVPRMFSKLVELLRGQFASNPESRVIIFVPKREYCEIGRQAVQAATGIVTSFISSTNASAKQQGMSPMQQVAALEFFSKGTTKVLVATSVAEEGLDIAKCNMVIKYHYVSSDIAHVQRKGRARDLSSRSILLTPKSKLEELEKQNAKRIEWLERALKYLGGMRESEVAEQLAERVKEYNEARLKAEEDELNSATRKPNIVNSFNVLCKGCHSILTTSGNIRLVGQCYHSFLCPDVERRFVTRSAAETERRAPNDLLLGSVYCKNFVGGRRCGHKLGIVVAFEKSFIPTLASDRVVFQAKHQPDKIYRYKTWRVVMEKCFHPVPLTSSEERLNILKFRSRPLAGQILEFEM